MEHEPFTWFGALGLPGKIATAGLVAGLLVVFAALVSRKLNATDAALEPEDGITARNLAEGLVEAIAGLAEGVIGHGAQRYVPLLASFFVFILACNLIGLVPGFSPPTCDATLPSGSITVTRAIGEWPHGG